MTNKNKTPERIWIDGAVKGNRWVTSPEQSYSPHGPYTRADITADLLEALEEVLDGLGFLSGGDHELEGWGIDEVRGAEIRAAIAKAKGETT